MSRTPRVVVVGDAGIDVVAHHNGALALDSDTRARVRLTEGGSGANTAQWLVASGAQAVLVGRVGADAAGRQVRTQLADAGVECALAEDADIATCCVVVIVDGAGRRTMLPDRGASGRLQAADVDPAVLVRASHLHLSGYVLLDPESRPAGVASLAAARAAGLTTSVDPQAAALLTDVGAFLDDVSGVDLLLPNADELTVLAGSNTPEAATALLDRIGAVVTTYGDQGATWVDRTTVVSVPAVPAAYVDPTGCGDAFDAGLIAAWLSGADPRVALERAVAVGALAVATLGARPPATGTSARPVSGPRTVVA